MSTHRKPQKSPVATFFFRKNFSEPQSKRPRCFFSNPRMGRGYIGGLEIFLGRWGGVRGRSAKKLPGQKKSAPMCLGARSDACVVDICPYIRVYIPFNQVGLWVCHLKELQHSSFVASDIHTIVVSISKENDSR